MSPELVQGHDADHRSDLFSLGIVLYEMLTGRLPFRGEHETAMMYEIVNVEPPPPSSIRPEIDADMDRIVLGCLEKDPNERTQSARQVSVDLKRCKRESARQRVRGILPAGVAAAQQGVGGRPRPGGDLPANDDLSAKVRRLLPWGLVCIMGVVAVLTLWNPWRGFLPLRPLSASLFRSRKRAPFPWTKTSRWQFPAKGTGSSTSRKTSFISDRSTNMGRGFPRRDREGKGARVFRLTESGSRFSLVGN